MHTLKLHNEPCYCILNCKLVQKEGGQVSTTEPVNWKKKSVVDSLHLIEAVGDRSQFMLQKIFLGAPESW